MADQCPKCGQKLKLFYLKQACPKCGVNLMYYDMENRLEQDALNAQKEVEKWNKVKAGFKAIFKRSH